MARNVLEHAYREDENLKLEDLDMKEIMSDPHCGNTQIIEAYRDREFDPNPENIEFTRKTEGMDEPTKRACNFTDRMDDIIFQEKQSLRLLRGSYQNRFGDEGRNIQEAVHEFSDQLQSLGANIVEQGITEGDEDHMAQGKSVMMESVNALREIERSNADMREIREIQEKMKWPESGLQHDLQESTNAQVEHIGMMMDRLENRGLTLKTVVEAASHETFMVSWDEVDLVHDRVQEATLALEDQGPGDLEDEELRCKYVAGIELGALNDRLAEHDNERRPTHDTPDHLHNAWAHRKDGNAEASERQARLAAAEREKLRGMEEGLLAVTQALSGSHDDFLEEETGLNSFRAHHQGMTGELGRLDDARTALERINHVQEFLNEKEKRIQPAIEQREMRESSRFLSDQMDQRAREILRETREKIEEAADDAAHAISQDLERAVIMGALSKPGVIENCIRNYRDNQGPG